MENPFFTMQSLFWYDYLASLNREEGSDDLRLLNSLYQIRYRQNYETLKIEHKDSLSQNISYVALKKYLHSGSEGRSFKEKIYIFLCALSFYEINNKKNYADFNSDDWGNFAKLFNPMTSEEIIFLFKNIFQNSVPTNNCKVFWSENEDLFLKQLILKNNQKRRLPWKKISLALQNEFKSANPKNPSQCAERWKNFLSTAYKTGEWSKADDVRIVSFVRKNGTKWSKLAKIIPHRTEHNIKNRFFSLLAKHFNSPILAIKENLNYGDPKILMEVLMSLK